MAVHVRYKSLYISLPSFRKQQREMTLNQNARTLRDGVGKRYVVEWFKVHIWKANIFVAMQGSSLPTSR